ncbi:MAG: hypothetical protein ABEN55_06730 [Bradymonadaceae bacterium]
MQREATRHVLALSEALRERGEMTTEGAQELRDIGYQRAYGYLRIIEHIQPIETYDSRRKPHGRSRPQRRFRWTDATISEEIIELSMPEDVLRRGKTAARTLMVSRVLRLGRELKAAEVEEAFGVARKTARGYLRTLEELQPVESSYDGSGRKVWSWEGRGE